MNWVYFFTYLFIFSLFPSRLWCESFHLKSRKIWIWVYMRIVCMRMCVENWKMYQWWFSLYIKTEYILIMAKDERKPRTENCLLFVEYIFFFLQKPHLLNNRSWFNSHRHMVWSESRRILSANILQSLDAFFRFFFCLFHSSCRATNFSVFNAFSCMLTA